MVSSQWSVVSGPLSVVSGQLLVALRVRDSVRAFRVF